MAQYFEERPAVPSDPSTVTLALPDVTLRLRVDRGVFSAGGVDAGTKLLLLEAPRPAADETGHLLDLGCGYGPIALTLAGRAPAATVWAVDVNERALGLCADNAADAGLQNVRVARPDDVPDDVRFAGLWSNPPIRIGKVALYAMLRTWLGRLDTAVDASGWLVVQRHLGADSLARAFGGRRLVSRMGYRILEVGPQ
jgi:16S rRNA (guanine1207-N2)-methyltransferase